MRLLHTADWHVGRTIRGRSRAEEHRAVLDELVDLAGSRAVDLVVVAGDQFDVQAPTPEAEGIVWAALVALAEVAPVVLVAGNHDNPRRLAAVRRLLAAHRIVAGCEVELPEDGGVARLQAADGTPVEVALLPFLHQRNAVRAADLLDPVKGAGEYGQDYSRLVGRFAERLCRGMTSSAVNLLVGHLTTFGGKLGGGEREAHTLLQYAVDPRGFPQDLDYVALGHLHEAQAPQGSAPPVHYCGSPLAMDFGETASAKHALVVEVGSGPAKVERVPLRSGRACRTLTGPLDAVLAVDADADPAEDDVERPESAWLRVVVQGDAPAGVADLVRAHFGERVVDVRVEVRPDVTGAPPGAERIGRSPHELFAEYCAERGVADDRVGVLFAALLAEAHEDEAHAAA